MDIFAHKTSYVTVDNTIERHSALGTQLYFHLRYHREIEDQLAFCCLSVISYLRLQNLKSRNHNCCEIITKETPAAVAENHKIIFINDIVCREMKHRFVFK
jgi:hypothetical protein